jgi:hypothetical protein
LVFVRAVVAATGGPPPFDEGGSMPTIAIVDGVKIQMFYNDHTPAHFHAILGSDEVLVAIPQP